MQSRAGRSVDAFLVVRLGQTASAQLHKEKSETPFRILPVLSVPLPEIWQTLSAEMPPCIKLSWSPYVELLSIGNPGELRFYDYKWLIALSVAIHGEMDCISKPTGKEGQMFKIPEKD